MTGALDKQCVAVYSLCRTGDLSGHRDIHVELIGIRGPGMTCKCVLYCDVNINNLTPQWRLDNIISSSFKQRNMNRNRKPFFVIMLSMVSKTLFWEMPRFPSDHVLCIIFTYSKFHWSKYSTCISNLYYIC
jgi:hypothetical protein